MNKSGLCLKKKHTLSITLLATLTLLALLLAACGGSDQPAASTGGSNSGSSTGSTSGSTSNMSAGNCDPMPKITFTEKTGSGADQYIFSPNTINIKAGQYISFINQTDEEHALVASPDAGLTSNTIDKNETQAVQFPKAGTFTVQSQDADHRGSVQVVVSAATGTTCGMADATTNVSFTEKTGAKDEYSFTPNTATLKEGQSISFLNKTDEDHTLKCTPSTGSNGDIKIDKNEHQIVTFSKDGEYTCSSVEHPDAKMTVTVK